jgi:esterase/lipase
MTRLAKGLADAGWAALRFDFTGLGEASGDFAATTVSTNVGDLSRAAFALIQRGYGPCALVGHSLGGAASLLAAQRLKTVDAVAVIGAPSDVEHIRHLFGDAHDQLLADGSVELTIGGRTFPIDASFLHDLQNHSVLDAVADLGRPLLVVVPGNDQVVDPAHGEAIYDAASEPRQLVRIAGADHLLTNQAHAQEALEALVDFLETT